MKRKVIDYSKRKQKTVPLRSRKWLGKRLVQAPSYLGKFLGENEEAKQALRGIAKRLLAEEGYYLANSPYEQEDILCRCIESNRIRKELIQAAELLMALYG